MFLRKIQLRRDDREYTYLKVVESVWENGRTSQKTLLNLGNADRWPTEKLEQLVRLLNRFLEHDQVFLEDVEFGECRQLGPYLPGSAMWETLGLEAMISKALQGRKIDILLGACAKAMVLNRLVEPRSKKALFESLEREVVIPGIDASALPLHYFYRSLEYLSEIKPKIEKELYLRLRHLFNLDVSLVFYDLTSSYFEGSHCSMAKYGYSRDHRPDLLQIEIGLLVNQEGIPIGHEVFEGSVKDVSTVIGTLRRLKKEFGVSRCVFVGDDGMASDTNLKKVEEQEYEYITSLSLRKSKVGAELVNTLAPHSTFERIEDNLFLLPLRKDSLGKDEKGRERIVRYIGSYNPQRAVCSREHRKQRIRSCMEYLRGLQAPPKPRSRKKTPEDILHAAERFVRNKGCQALFELRLSELRLSELRLSEPRLSELRLSEPRLCQEQLSAKGATPEQAVEAKVIEAKVIEAKVIEAKVIEERVLEWRLDRKMLRMEHRMDGLLVLQTNSQTLSDWDVAQGYRTLWKVEDAFKHIKCPLELRPIRHWKDPRVLGHIFICVLAYTIERLLEQSLEKAGMSVTAMAALGELRTIQVATLEAEGLTVRRRSKITARQQQLLSAMEVAAVPEFW